MCASIRTAHNIFKSGKCLLIGWKVPWLGWITAWLQTLWWTAARHPVCWRHSWYVMLLTSLVLCNVRTNTIAFVSDCLGEMWYCKAVFFKFLPFSWSKCVNEYEYLTFTDYLTEKIGLVKKDQPFSLLFLLYIINLWMRWMYFSVYFHF